MKAQLYPELSEKYSVKFAFLLVKHFFSSALRPDRIAQSTIFKIRTGKSRSRRQALGKGFHLTQLSQVNDFRNLY